MAVSTQRSTATVTFQHITSTSNVQEVIVHPLVLLSVVDHFSRMTKGSSKKRVAGALLGATKKGGKMLDVSNSFAVPFDEDKDVWYMDYDYLEQMWAMFKKVNAREKIVGWYHTGPKLKQSDVAICEALKMFHHSPVLVVVNVNFDESFTGLPIDSYLLAEEVHEDGTPASKTFERVTCSIDAEEAEEVGVEHLLRDIGTSSIGSLAQQMYNKLNGLNGFQSSLEAILSYIDAVLKDRLPCNQHVLRNVQDMLNMLTPLELSGEAQLSSSFSVLNDQMMVLYISMLCRAIIALHDLINNKIHNRTAERNAAIAAVAAASVQANADPQVTV